VPNKPSNAEEVTHTAQAEQPGSYWYHSHDIAQYPDGLRGPLVVQDPSGPYAGKYDAELVITVSDWYHDQMPSLSASYLSIAKDSDGNEPEPYSALINDRQNTSIFVEPGLTYYVRLINIGAFSQFWFQIDQHPFSIIEVDGNYVNLVEVQNCFITVGQRYGLLMKTKPTADQNYAILGSMDEAMYDEMPAYVNNNVTGYLVYNKNHELPPPLTVPASDFTIFDDFSLRSVNEEAVLENPIQTIIMDLNFTQEFNQNRYV
jgi:iron transport multicopper oxidase